ncbi:MAG: hypothetical protein A2481_03550 [Candidatus Yonathbacteria bacterium RIFOXYC2_FULL_47_9]|nr:MAG: hypothetical protein A2481_03550 [Candidatus Yonathbacteria bacterium RIFOXYC2_FULL_47_9]HAT68037.1 hypothetical protein [Candidatus Yonathbacteria bacterium]
MTDILSTKEVDAKLAEIAHQIREQYNNLNHGIDAGHDVMVVHADRKLVHLRREWDKPLLLQGVICGECQKTRPLSQWKFFYGWDHEMVEAIQIRCPCCGLTAPLSEHSMSARINWLIGHAYAEPKEFLPNVEIAPAKGS